MNSRVHDVPDLNKDDQDRRRLFLLEATGRVNESKKLDRDHATDTFTCKKFGEEDLLPKHNLEFVIQNLNTKDCFLPSKLENSLEETFSENCKAVELLCFPPTSSKASLSNIKRIQITDLLDKRLSNAVNEVNKSRKACGKGAFPVPERYARYTANAPLGVNFYRLEGDTEADMFISDHIQEVAVFEFPKNFNLVVSLDSIGVAREKIFNSDAVDEEFVIYGKFTMKSTKLSGVRKEKTLYAPLLKVDNILIEHGKSDAVLVTDYDFQKHKERLSNHVEMKNDYIKFIQGFCEKWTPNNTLKQAIGKMGVTGAKPVLFCDTENYKEINEHITTSMVECAKDQNTAIHQCMNALRLTILRIASVNNNHVTLKYSNQETGDLKSLLQSMYPEHYTEMFRKIIQIYQSLTEKQIVRPVDNRAPETKIHGFVCDSVSDSTLMANAIMLKLGYSCYQERKKIKQIRGTKLTFKDAFHDAVIGWNSNNLSLKELCDISDVQLQNKKIVRAVYSDHVGDRCHGKQSGHENRQFFNRMNIITIFPEMHYFCNLNEYESIAGEYECTAFMPVLQNEIKGSPPVFIEEFLNENCGSSEIQALISSILCQIVSATGIKDQVGTISLSCQLLEIFNYKHHCAPHIVNEAMQKFPPGNLKEIMKIKQDKVDKILKVWKKLKENINQEDYKNLTNKHSRWRFFKIVESIKNGTDIKFDTGEVPTFSQDNSDNDCLQLLQLRRTRQ